VITKPPAITTRREALPEVTGAHLAIADIKIGQRYRQDMGDVTGLAASISNVGLLHPIVIRPTGELIAGERRIKACLSLGWTEIPVTVVDIAEIVRGEYAENNERKDFTLSEAVAIKRSIEPVIEAEAKERQVIGARAKGKAPANLAGAGDARDKIAKATGKKRSTLAKAEKVVEAAEAEPQKFAPLVEEMDRTGEVDGPYRRLNASKASASEIASAEPTSDVTKSVKVSALIEAWDSATKTDRAEFVARNAPDLRELLIVGEAVA
jgi:ParB family transcriptional regulator, chromosome partitioning protein